MSYDEEALKYVSEQAVTAAEKRVIWTGDHRALLVEGDGSIKEFKPDDGAKEIINVHTLTAVVDYILKTNERNNEPLIVQVVDQDNVSILGELDQYGNRETLLKAKALHPWFEYGRFLSQEDFIILLQSQFVANEDREILLKVVGNLKEEDARVQTDDGVTQIATARTGVAAVGDVVIPNPVKLMPYRTFLEVEQPESSFVFRMQSGPSIALFESDGGQWRNEAISRIASYLSEKLSSTDGRITILA